MHEHDRGHPNKHSDRQNGKSPTGGRPAEGVPEEELPDARTDTEGAFCHACIVGDVATVERMLRHEPTLVGAFGEVREDHRDFMRQFGAQGGWSPLHLAGHYGQAGVVRLLLSAGADTEMVSRNVICNRPLGSAVAGGNTEVVRLLAEGGAVLDARDGSGLTALHLAADGKLHEISTVLLKAGADRHAKDKAGRTPADIALKAGDEAGAALLG